MKDLLEQGLVPGVDEAVTLDRLAGDWKIFQLAAGHRFSVDDQLVAWMASRVGTEATRLIDLGAGLGSVGLITLWALGSGAARTPAPTLPPTLTMVEAQEQSHRLAIATLAINGLHDRVIALLGDMRGPIQGLTPPYDLVTGSPPYFPLGTGKVSPHPQKAACRMELRGTIADYALAAASLLGDSSWFVACFPARDPRGEAAFPAAGLCVRASCDVIFREGMDPMIRLYAAQRLAGPRVVWPPLTIRAKDGRWTETYMAVRRELGVMSPDETPRPTDGAAG
ncbi:MAG: SAM-dependent methyltransferase [Myxococcales bacterium]|nr:SAM-dependent methyltransferase [Myxococcales bacterium]